MNGFYKITKYKKERKKIEKKLIKIWKLIDRERITQLTFV
jgi:hypothetical protein